MKLTEKDYEENRRLMKEKERRGKKKLIKIIFKVVLGIIAFIIATGLIMEAGEGCLFTLFILAVLFAVDYYQQCKEKDKKFKQLERDYIQCLRELKRKTK
ncbi:hypothetical protein KAU40_01180 [Candidatus Parcubacteria bacterium]|nr:hypothetical protein [Candidatus Parcubacteria bacterium]